MSEGPSPLQVITAVTKSHIDGRDLLDELHPRRRIDICVRRDGKEYWYEGDWLSNLREVLQSLNRGDDRWKLYVTDKELARVPLPEESSK